jgi:urease accessory protein
LIDLHSGSVTRSFSSPDDTITLGETDRHRRRMKMVSDNGVEFMLMLPEARLLTHGDGLVLDDGRIIEVLAQPESLYQVFGKGSHHLLQLSWHMGNRHLPAQVMDDHIRIRSDHVMRTMLEGLGAQIREITAPFDPESGAYHQHSQTDHSND